MNTTSVALGLLAGAILLGPASHSWAATETSGTPGGIRVVQLAEEKSLDEVVPLPGGLADSAAKGVNVTQQVLTLIHHTTHVPLIVITREQIPASAVLDLPNRPAREALLALAKVVKSEWRRYDEFLILIPSDAIAGKAVPKSLASAFPELKRKITGTYAATRLSDALWKLSHWNNVTLGLYVSGRPPARLAYLGGETTIAAEGTSVDALMQALTAITGAPWDSDGSYHVLCLSGEKLTDADRQKLIPGKALRAFNDGLTDAQLTAMYGEAGLPLTVLPRAQVQLFLTGAASVLQEHNAAAPGLVLKIQTAGDDMIFYGYMEGRRFQPIGAFTFK